MTSITIPERNRAIKKLLQRTYAGVAISVRAGTGTAYHWVHIEFRMLPEELRPFASPVLRYAHVRTTIEQAGIHIHTFVSDGDYTGECVTIDFPRDV